MTAEHCRRDEKTRTLLKDSEERTGWLLVLLPAGIDHDVRSLTMTTGKERPMRRVLMGTVSTFIFALGLLAVDATAVYAQQTAPSTGTATGMNCPAGRSGPDCNDDSNSSNSSSSSQGSGGSSSSSGSGSGGSGSGSSGNTGGSSGGSSGSGGSSSGGSGGNQ
jgi:hypothetical protein